MAREAEEIQAVIDNLRRVFQALNEYSRNAERATGLTGPQLWAMKLVANGTPTRVTQLARQMYLHPATVVGILDRLESRGLVTRTRSKTDRRAVDVALTELGEQMVTKAPEVAQGMLVKGLEALTDEQFSRLAEGMGQVTRMLGAEHLIPYPLHAQ